MTSQPWLTRALKPRENSCLGHVKDPMLGFLHGDWEMMNVPHSKPFGLRTVAIPQHTPDTMSVQAFPLLCDSDSVLMSVALRKSYLSSCSLVASVVSDPMDCSPPGCSVHGILQARTLEWVAISSSRGPSRPRDQTQVSRTGKRIIYH